MDNAALGRRMHEARKRCSMSSDKLAELCGVGAVHIRKIESGAKLPSIKIFVAICNALHTSPQYLLQDSLEPNDLEAQIQILNKMNQLQDTQSDMLCTLLNSLLDVGTNNSGTSTK